MPRFIELRSVDQHGSGLTFPAVIDKDRIVAVLDLTDYEGRPARSACMIMVADINPSEPMFVTASYADLKEALNV